MHTSQKRLGREEACVRLVGLGARLFENSFRGQERTHPLLGLAYDPTLFCSDSLETWPTESSPFILSGITKFAATPTLGFNVCLVALL